MRELTDVAIREFVDVIIRQFADVVAREFTDVVTRSEVAQSAPVVDDPAEVRLAYQHFVTNFLKINIHSVLISQKKSATLS